MSADSEAIAATCVEAFEFLGLFGTDAANDSLAEAIERGATPRDALCDRLQVRLQCQRLSCMDGLARGRLIGLDGGGVVARAGKIELRGRRE